MRFRRAILPRKETVLVTGASGFIGGWISEMLFLRRLAEVRAGIKSWVRAARLARFPMEIVICDVLDKESIIRAMTGVDCVIHSVAGSEEAIVQGTRNVLEIASAQNVRRFVHLSSTDIYGNVHGRIDETFSSQYVGNPYADAKIEAENLCWEFYDNGLPVTVVRPSIVYGPFGKDWTVAIAQRMKTGSWGVFKGIGEGICNLTYVVDLVGGIWLAACHEDAVGETFNLSGPQTMTWNQYFREFNAALGLPNLRVIDPISAQLRAAAMRPLRSLGKFTLKHFTSPLRRLSQDHSEARRLLRYAERRMRTAPRIEELDLYSRQAVYLIDKAKDVLGYSPQYQVEKGLELTAQWLRNVGAVNSSP